MKKLVLTLVVVLSVTTSVFSQTNRKTEMMEDSLWKSLYKFCKTTETYLNKDYVSQVDVNNFLTYLYNHMGDSVQTTDFYVPFTTTKDQAMSYLTEQTKDMVGSSCKYYFVSWDGWDGKTPFTGFRFDILHDGYKDQFLVIVNTKNEVTSIYSINSKL